MAEASGSKSFVPQYFEIREVGKHIKSTKKQYIWRFQIDEKDITVELFNSALSSKKKIMVNNQLKAEMKQKSESFMYQMTVQGKRITLQAVNDSFDLVVEGSMFQVLWEQEKRKNAFNWENKGKKHDPFAVHQFGGNVDRVVAPTTRDLGSKQAMELQVLDRGESEELKDNAQDQADGGARQRAIADLKKEKEQVYNELKSSFGKEEADELIKQFMSGRYKKRMEEIDRIYSEDSAKKQRQDSEAKRLAKEKSRRKRQEQEQKEREQKQEAAFEFGFDHGFESMATYQGQEVGKKGQGQSSKPEGAQSEANRAEKVEQKPPSSFDFNFDDGPSAPKEPSAQAQFNIDDLLSGGQNQAKSGSEAVKNDDLFDFDKIKPEQQNIGAAGMNAAAPGQNLAGVPGAQQQPAPPQGAFIPNPMSHKQGQMQQMMQQNQMMQMMAQHFQTNVMMQQQQMAGMNPFAAMQGQQGPNQFMTNPAQPGINAYSSFQQQPQMQQPGMAPFNQPNQQQQPPQSSSNPFAGI